MKSSKKRKGVVLLSGGLDSSTVIAIARSQGYKVWALSFDYGQKQTIELERAKVIAQKNKVEKHLILEINLNQIGGSALTSDIAVPKNNKIDKLAQKNHIPVTYVPARNIIFLSYALSWAEVIGANNIFLGINAVDYSGYPDCRPEFLSAFIKMANIGTKKGSQGEKFNIHAPLMKMSKKEIIQTGIKLGVDYSLTHSCYDPVGSLPCGQCDACQLRLQGFAEAGITDPLTYNQG